MQYFKSRSAAGKLLADKLEHYKGQSTAVIALSEGSVLVGAEISKRIHASLYLLASEDIGLPREPVPIGALSSAGIFTSNRAISAGELEEMSSDYRSLIDQEKFEAFQHLNRIVGKDGDIRKSLLKRHNIILVSDGLNNALSLDVASDFIKPIPIKKLIIATPIATIQAIDHMHLLADELFYIGMVDNYISTNHYYDKNKIPDHKTVVEIMQKIVLSWDKKDSKTAANK